MTTGNDNKRRTAINLTNYYLMQKMRKKIKNHKNKKSQLCDESFGKVHKKLPRQDIIKTSF